MGLILWGIIGSLKSIVNIINVCPSLETCYVIFLIREVIQRNIYEYLRQARIVYVPVVSDYERWFNISQNDLRRNEVLYPQDTIEVYKNDPFRILFLWEDDEEYYEVYPHIDSETQIDNPDNED